MAKDKQNIFIGSRAGNRRVEQAVPVFMDRYGWAEDQATAVAIRLESIGRLMIDATPGTITSNPKIHGAAGLATAALGVSYILKEDREVIVESKEVDDLDKLERIYRPRKVKKAPNRVPRRLRRNRR